MFPYGEEIKIRYYGAITSKLNELIESKAKFGNMYIDVTRQIQDIGSELEVILVDHGYEVIRYNDYNAQFKVNISRTIINWDNEIEVDNISNSKLVTSTRLRKSRMKEIIMLSVASDFREDCVSISDSLQVSKLCLNDDLWKNSSNPIVQDCIKTICTYGYTYNETTNKFTPI